jgi:hypothetical protein
MRISSNIWAVSIKSALIYINQDIFNNVRCTKDLIRYIFALKTFLSRVSRVWIQFDVDCKTSGGNQPELNSCHLLGLLYGALI